MTVVAKRLNMGRMRRPLPPSMMEGFARPGADTRQWISYGTVAAGEESIEFDADYGPLITVVLQPSNITVVCRVGMSIAGNGEGEYNPFISGDEVLVALPEGSERAGPVIVSRLTNSIDKFPENVAGQDPTTNSFAMKRQRTARVEEIAGPYLLRQATTGALLSIDASGTLSLRGGDSSMLQLSASAFAWQSQDAEHILQLDQVNGRFTLKVGDALLTLSNSSALPPSSGLVCNGSFAISAGAAPPIEHVLTTEAFCHILVNVLSLFVLPPAMMPLPPSTYAPQVATALATASAAPLEQTVAATLFGLFLAPVPKPPGVPGQGQSLPGIGCRQLLTG